MQTLFGEQTRTQPQPPQPPPVSYGHLRQRSFTVNVFTLFCFILILIASIPFAVYVWPTKYAYDRIHINDSEYPVRVRRWTGDAEYLALTGWTPLRPAEQTRDALGRPLDLFGNPITATPTPNPR